MARRIASARYLGATQPQAITGYPFTLSAWYKPATLTDGFVIALCGSKSTSPYDGYCGIRTRNTGAVRIQIDSGDRAPVIAPESGASATAIGTWYRLTAVFASATDRRLYINNAKYTDTGSEGFPAGIDGISIGCLQYYHASATPSIFADGDIADPAVWSSALSDEEQGLLASGFTADQIRPESLVYYWPLNGNVNPEPDIISGYSLNCITTGANAAPIYAPDPPLIRKIDPIYQQMASYLVPSAVTYTLLCDPATFTVTAAAADVLYHRALNADPASFTVSATDAGLVQDYVFNADPSSFSVSATDADLTWHYVLAADPSSLTITSADADLLSLYSLHADPASFAVTSTDAGLLGDFTLNAEPSSFAVTSADAWIGKEFVMNLDPSSFSVSATDAGLLGSFAFNVDPSSFTVTATDAIVGRELSLSAEPSSYTVTATDAELHYTRSLLADPASFTVTPTAADLHGDFSLNAEPASFVVTGSPLTFLRYRVRYDTILVQMQDNRVLVQPQRDNILVEQP